MSFFSDLKILFHFVAKPIRGKSHAARMENYYEGQAENYDDFRRRLLQGRQQLCDAIEVPQDGVWVDMGGGTGSNLEYFADRIEQFQQIFIVDLSTSLLKMAADRSARRGWKNVETVEADATTFQPPDAAADLVTFSYSLTMIPDWFAAIENARNMLKPGGLIGVVDFYVSRKYPSDGRQRHNAFTRGFWPTWFASNNVYPSPDHVPFLHRHFEPLCFEEHRAKIPYIPLIRMPYYWFVGRKREPK